MEIRKISVIIPVLALAVLALTSSAYAGYGLGNSKSSTLSVYAASDGKGNGSGFGVSYLTPANIGTAVQDISYTHVTKYSMIQMSMLSPKVISSFPVNIGLTVGYSSPLDNSDATKGLMTGLEAILVKSKTDSGLSMDIRVASLRKGVNPVKWVTSPDALYAGAGVSYTF